ncbi:MAG: hypothetical protein CHACPFDD_03066 [Phycisphaerae bacterium]|nr:hypothetical protein [Phycisphaerae bacterium]
MTGHWTRVMFLMLAGLPALAQERPLEPATRAVAAEEAPIEEQPVEALVARLGDDDYQRREAAMWQLVARGSGVADELGARFRIESDPEIRHRLKFVLEAVLPPDQAVLVVRASLESPIQPGDCITHVNFRRIRRTSELAALSHEGATTYSVRVHGPNGPRELSNFDLRMLTTCREYRAPRGPTLAEIVRLYHQGYAEEAYARLEQLPGAVPPDELSPLLRALITFTAGHETAALAELTGESDVVNPVNRRSSDAWSSPSPLDLAGPFEAPYHLEELIWRGRTESGERSSARDRDLAIQRVLVPAGRYSDAALRACAMWFNEFRGAQPMRSRSAEVGNTLAVASWMLAEMGLTSECVRLIEPRSRLLGATWVRVHLRCWPTFLEGRASDALVEVYDDARDIMQREDIMFPALIRNPHVAASVAFFLYQSPDEQRIGEMLDAVTDPARPGYSAMGDYARWMCFGVTPANHVLVRRDLTRLVDKLTIPHRAEYARALALLEYVQDKPNGAAIDAAREIIAGSPASPLRAQWLTECEILKLLTEDRPRDVLQILAGQSDLRPFAAWRSTAALRLEPPVGIEPRDIRLAVPCGMDGAEWLVLDSDRRITRVTARDGRRRAVQMPANWFPGPANWPWLSREESSGRTWTYDRRRVIELTADEKLGLRLNIEVADIPLFERYAGARFSLLDAALRGYSADGAENGEFRREDIRANAEFVADPDLPEVGSIRPIRGQERFVSVAIRGGAQLLLDTETDRAWSSVWFAERLGIPRMPVFDVIAAPSQSTPVLMLTTDLGLVRFDVAEERVSRIPLPDEPSGPAVVPENVPYERSDPRWMYVARLPRDGGQVYRVNLADNGVERVDLINEALPDRYYRLRTRGEIRAAVDADFLAGGLPKLVDLIADAQQIVKQLVEAEP